MTSKEMVIEFKVILDKVDTQSYPDFHVEQIYLFINKAINEYVTQLRSSFELTQQIADDGKALIKEITVTPTELTPDVFGIGFPLDYFYLLRCNAVTLLDGDSIKARMVYTQNDDIEVILDDPFNKPKPHKVPYTYQKNGLLIYSDDTFAISKVKLVYLREPSKVDSENGCDLEQIHSSIVSRAVQLAIETVESPRVQTFNK
jgi:hypothetical protein